MTAGDIGSDKREQNRNLFMAIPGLVSILARML